MRIQIGWCDRCDSFIWGIERAAPVCPKCHGSDKVKRALLSPRASKFFLRLVNRTESKVVRPSDERLIKLPGEQ